MKSLTGNELYIRKKPISIEYRKKLLARNMKFRSPPDWRRNRPNICEPTKEHYDFFVHTLARYRKGFDDICIAAYDAYSGNECSAITSAGKLIYSHIIPRAQDKAIELNDIKSFLLLIWYKGCHRYKHRCPKVTLYNYLLRMSLFELKLWLKRQPISPEVDFLFDSAGGGNRFLNKIDLKFLIKGNSDLSSHDRYILYLSALGYDNMSEIPEILHCTRRSLYSYRQELISKLEYLALGLL